MNPQPHDFETLRRLLALKRHEQPPPSYFDQFSRQVMARIRAEDRGGYFWETAWIQRLWAAIEARPVLAGGVGMLVCGLLVWVVAFSGPPPEGVPGRDTPISMISSVARAAEPAAAERPELVGFSSTNGGILPATEARPSLFSDLATPRAQPAAFHVPGGN